MVSGRSKTSSYQTGNGHSLRCRLNCVPYAELANVKLHWSIPNRQQVKYRSQSLTPIIDDMNGAIIVAISKVYAIWMYLPYILTRM